MYKGHTKEMSGYKDDVTGNVMEITAIIEALKVLKRPCDCKVYSDSEYVVNTFNKNWLNRWLKNGWKTANGKIVKNKEKWVELLKLVNKQENVEFIKVKGHSDNVYNNRCDEMATEAIKKRKENFEKNSEKR